MNDKEILRLGTGSAHGWDNLEAALELANSGECEYLIFDCLSEKVALIWARNRQENRAPGWDPRLESRMRLTIPACASTQTKIVTNVGASNPAGAAVKIKELCAEVGVPHLKVMAVVGDNVFDLIRKLDPLMEETGQPVSAFGDRFRAASAYCPVRPWLKLWIKVPISWSRDGPETRHSTSHPCCTSSAGPLIGGDWRRDWGLDI